MIPILIGFCVLQTSVNSLMGLKVAEGEHMGHKMNEIILCTEEELALNSSSKFFTPIFDIFQSHNYIEILPVELTINYSPDIFYPDLNIISVTVLRL